MNCRSTDPSPLQPDWRRQRSWALANLGYQPGVSTLGGMVPLLSTRGAAAVGGGEGATEMVAMQIAQHAVLAHGYGLAVEAVILGAPPTVVAHTGACGRDVGRICDRFAPTDDENASYTLEQQRCCAGRWCNTAVVM